MFRFYEILIFLFFVLYALYIITCICQLLGVFKISYQQIELGKMFIPFHYWIHRNP